MGVFVLHLTYRLIQLLQVITDILYILVVNVPTLHLGTIDSMNNIEQNI